jgi:uncharacterized protein (DUF1330 family)
MPAGFVIAEIEIINGQLYEDYATVAVTSVAKYGGEFLVRRGQYQSLEGDAPLPIIFVVRFPSYQQALAWYYSQEYTQIKELRHNAARSNIVVVEGSD